MTLMKYLWTAAALAGLAIGGCAAPNGAKTAANDFAFKTYQKASLNESTQKLESNVIAETPIANVGSCYRAENGKEPAEVWSLKTKLDGCPNLVAHTSVNNETDKTDSEASVKYKIDEFLIDAGAGEKNEQDFWQAGLMYNFLKNEGFSVGYVSDKDPQTNVADGVRASAWKYFPDQGVFVGLRKVDTGVRCVFALPGENTALRVVGDYNYDTKTNWNQVIFGTEPRSKERYALDFADAFFVSNDSALFGDEAVRAGDSAFRYIPSPVAWRVKDFGSQANIVRTPTFTQTDVEIAKYLTKEFWLGASYQNVNRDEGDDTNKVGLGFGLFKDKFKIGMRFDKDVSNSENNSAFIDFTFGF